MLVCPSPSPIGGERLRAEFEGVGLTIGVMNRTVCVCRCYRGWRSGEDDAGAERNG